MDIIFYLIVAYGVCFGLQNKVSFLYGKSQFLDSLLACTYCTGFHCGWITWLLAAGIRGSFPCSLPQLPLSILASAFASAAFCYVIDAVVKYFEVNSATEE